jgi:hypothetical protein
MIRRIAFSTQMGRHQMNLPALTKSLQRAKTVDELKVGLEQCAQVFGCEKYTYILANIGFGQDRALSQIETDAEFLTNLDAEWTKRYQDRKYFRIDPIVHECYRSSLPVVWSSATLPREITPDIAEMLLDAFNNGLQRGISVPIHGFSGEFGIFSLYSPWPEGQFQTWAEAKAFEVQWFAFWLHDFYASRFSQSSNVQHGQLEISIRSRWWGGQTLH